MSTFEPTAFGKYTLLERIGVDPVAELYRASHVDNRDTAQPVLIKKFLPQVTKDPALTKLFSNAARVSSLFDHQNIARVLDYGFVEEAFYIATEYLSGYSLQQLLAMSRERKRPFTPSNAAHIATEACYALQYAHEFKDPLGSSSGLVHGHLSPDAVFITFEGKVKLTDFGIQPGNTPEGSTQLDGLNTWLSYLSPEQVAGNPADCRSDLFSLGTLLYEMVTGRQTFRGKSMEIFSKVRHVKYEPLEKAAPHLSSELGAVVAQSLQKKPDDRYASAGEMLKALKKVRSFMAKPSLDQGLSGYFSTVPTGVKEGETATTGSETGIPPMSSTAGGTGHKSVVGKRPSAASTAGASSEGKTVSPTAVQTAKEKDPAEKRDAGMPKPVKGRGQPSNTMSPSISRSNSKSIPKSGGRSKAWCIAVPAALCMVVAVTLVLRGNAEWAGFTSKTPSRIETAMAALDRGDLHAAISQFEEAIAARPEDLKRVSGPFAQALEGQASQILKTDPKRAETLLLKARELDPRHVQIYTTLGLLYLNRKDYPKAIEVYQSAIELNPRMADIFFNLGYIYAVREDYRRAQKMYARTVDLSPPFLDEALFNLAVIEGRLGKHKECVRNLKRALKHNPDNKQVRNYLEQLTT